MITTIVFFFTVRCFFLFSFQREILPYQLEEKSSHTHFKAIVKITRLPEVAPLPSGAFILSHVSSIVAQTA